ncbi:MAG: ATP-binding protein [Spartobacteria bacterium]|nr:ATP-binding protein [Spartobacteria bacterium]
MQIITGKQKTKQRAVIYGPEGIGKSSLAAEFPNPVFIDTEGSTNQLDVARTPAPKDWDQVMAYIKELAGSDFGTVVVDTADWAEELAKQDVCAKNKLGSIEDMGYGKGYVYVAERWRHMLAALQGVVNSGKHVVVVAHAMITKFEQPDEMGAYDRYEMRLIMARKNNLSAMLKEWADMVLFLNYRTMVVEDETGKKKAQGGKRVVYTEHTPSWDAKNRHDLPSMMPVEKGRLPAELAAALDATTEKKPKQSKPAKKAEKVEEKEPTAEDVSNVIDNMNIRLAKLLKAADITPEQLKTFYVEKGHQPADVEPDALPETYVNKVVNNWDKVRKTIKGE